MLMLRKDSEKQRKLVRGLLTGSLAVAVACMMLVASAAVADETKVRDFPADVVRKLGAEIYKQDMSAARATDLLLQASGGPQALESEGVRGTWIVTGNEREVIRFVREDGN